MRVGMPLASEAAAASASASSACSTSSASITAGQDGPALVLERSDDPVVHGDRLPRHARDPRPISRPVRRAHEGRPVASPP